MKETNSDVTQMTNVVRFLGRCGMFGKEFSESPRREQLLKYRRDHAKVQSQWNVVPVQVLHLILTSILDEKYS